jgi:hypothetical protein
MKVLHSSARMTKLNSLKKSSNKRKVDGGGSDSGQQKKSGGKTSDKKKSKSAASTEAAEDEDFTSFSEVPWVLFAKVPGYFFSFAPEEDVHAALQYHHLPQGLVRGKTAAESSDNLKDW